MKLQFWISGLSIYLTYLPIHPSISTGRQAGRQTCVCINTWLDRCMYMCISMCVYVSLNRYKDILIYYTHLYVMLYIALLHTHTHTLHLSCLFLSATRRTTCAASTVLPTGLSMRFRPRKLSGLVLVPALPPRPCCYITHLWGFLIMVALHRSLNGWAIWGSGR